MVEKERALAFLGLSPLSKVTLDKSFKFQMSTLVDCFETFKTVGINGNNKKQVLNTEEWLYRDLRFRCLLNKIELAIKETAGRQALIKYQQGFRKGKKEQEGSWRLESSNKVTGSWEGKGDLLECWGEMETTNQQN